MRRFFSDASGVIYIALAVVFLAIMGYLLYPHIRQEYVSIRLHGIVGLGAQDLAKEYGEKVTINDTLPLVHKESPRSETVDRAVPVKPSNAIEVPVLMYHHVGFLPEKYDAVRADLTVHPQDFEREVSWLHDHGYTSVTLQQIYLATQKKFQLPAKPVAFTFDDGYSDVFDNAVPILQKYGYTGSFAIITGFVGNPDYATWEQITAAHTRGMEIVSHTYDHFDGKNSKFNADFIEKDLRLSLSELDAHMQDVPRILIYPYGHYTPEYIAVAKRVGFTMAYTVHYGRFIDLENLLESPRVRVHGNETLDRFIESVGGKVMVKR